MNIEVIPIKTKNTHKQLSSRIGESINFSLVLNGKEVIIPEENAGNLHFAATFTKTEDIVKANSEKISSGTISLGNELNGGSAQLTVNDVELSSDKISGFKDAAGDYTISNYLDIDLYNIFYKGKDDAEDVWANKIDELDKDGRITYLDSSPNMEVK